MNRQPRMPLIVAACFAAMTGIAATQDAAKAVQPPPPKSSDSPDAWLTAKVKLALLTANDVPALSIDVDTVNDVVTLSGKVAEEGEKNRAAEVAKGVEGVKQVKNILQVVPESRMKVVEKADAEIKDSVQKTLTTDKTLDGISVKAVDNGVVLLAGKATTANAVKAVRAAREAPGVKRVASEIALDK